MQVERLKENREKRRAQQAQILEDQEVTILVAIPDPDPYIQQYPYIIITVHLGFAKPRPRQPELGVLADDPRLQGAAGVQPPCRRRPHEQPSDHCLH